MVRFMFCCHEDLVCIILFSCVLFLFPLFPNLWGKNQSEVSFPMPFSLRRAEPLKGDLEGSVVCVREAPCCVSY